MRTTIVAVTVLLLAAPAVAEQGKESSLPKEERTGSAAPTAATSSSTDASAGDTIDRSVGSELIGESKKRWRIDAGWESHALLVSNNLLGSGANTFFNYFYAGGRYELTPGNDQVRVTAGFYQFALTDPNEDGGLRSDDIYFSYDHHFALPKEFGLDARVVTNAPTSFMSYKMGLITAPEGVLELTRTVGKYLTFDLRGIGEYFFESYTSVQGGSTPNPIARLGAGLNVEGALPWHPDLALGVDVYTEYFWFYYPNGQPGAMGPSSYYGVENFPTYPVQPAQQNYGGDVYVRYSLNKILPKTGAKGLKGNVELAYANGDPTMGYTSELVDGVSSIYLFYPETSQVFFSLNLYY